MSPVRRSRSFKRTFRVVIPLWVIAMGGCDGSAEAPGVAAPAITDSAGIRIVEHLGFVSPDAGISLAPEPDWRYGDEEDEYLFQRILVGALQPDGGAVVWAFGNRELVRIDPTTNSHTILARRGEGPGELGGVQGVYVPGQDTVLVDDSGNRRLVRYEQGESVEPSWSFQREGYETFIRSHGLDSAGVWLMGTASFTRGFADAWLQGHLMRLDVVGGTLDSLATYDMVPQELNGELGRNPFPPTGRVAVSRGGFIVHRSDRADVTWLDATGAPRQIVRWPVAESRMTEQDLADWEDWMRVEFRRVNPERAAAELNLIVGEFLQDYDLEPGGTKPVSGSLHGDDRGRAWVGPFNQSGVTSGGSGYLVFDADGGWLGEVELPERFEILDIAHGRVLGVMRDDFDVESAAVFRLAGGG